MGKFEGIREFHEGLVVSDYVNMIPLGETCLDSFFTEPCNSLLCIFKTA